MSQELNETIDTITIIYNTRSAYKYPIYIASISHPHLEHINDIHQVCYTHNWYNDLYLNMFDPLMERWI